MTKLISISIGWSLGYFICSILHGSFAIMSWTETDRILFALGMLISLFIIVSEEKKE